MICSMFVKLPLPTESLPSFADSLSLLNSVVAHVNHHCALSHHIHSNQAWYALKK
jgi:hypothetical protein